MTYLLSLELSSLSKAIVIVSVQIHCYKFVETSYLYTSYMQNVYFPHYISLIDSWLHYTLVKVCGRLKWINGLSFKYGAINDSSYFRHVMFFINRLSFPDQYINYKFKQNHKLIKDNIGFNAPKISNAGF